MIDRPFDKKMRFIQNFLIANFGKLKQWNTDLKSN